MTSSSQKITVGNRLKHNYDMLIIMAGIAVLPLAGPVEDYYVSVYTSVASGAGLMVWFAALGIVIIGLVLRIYRSISGSIYR